MNLYIRYQVKLCCSDFSFIHPFIHSLFTFNHAIRHNPLTIDFSVSWNHLHFSSLLPGRNVDVVGASISFNNGSRFQNKSKLYDVQIKVHVVYRIVWVSSVWIKFSILTYTYVRYASFKFRYISKYIYIWGLMCKIYLFIL